MDQYEDIDKYFQVRVEIGRQEIEEADHFGAFLRYWKYYIQYVWIFWECMGMDDYSDMIILLLFTTFAKPLHKYKYKIKPMHRSIAPPNPRAPQFQSRRDVRELTNIEKNLYDNFSIFQLESCRLIKLTPFVELLEEIRMFNDQLDRWKKNQHDIKNLRITYHLYENLFSRMKYISNFSRSEEESQTALAKLYEWFGEEKPKKRCQVKETPAMMKTYTSDSKETQRIDKMLQANVVKRELEAYEMMSRTAHPGMFPPKQQLKMYKRKNFLPFSTSQPLENPITVKKSTSASLLSKYKLSKFRMSVGTMATSATSFKEQKQNPLKNTITQFKIDNIPEDNKGQGQKQDQVKNEAQAKAEQQNMEQLQRQANVQKQQILQGNLVPQLGEQDAPDEQGENIYEDQQIKENKKLYVNDYDPEEIDYQKQLAKQNQQSTLRRMMKINENKIRSKLEDLDLQRNMANWGKIKGRMSKQQSRKLEGLLNCNKYKDVAFRKKSLSQVQDLPGPKGMSSTVGFTNYKKPTKEPIVVPMLYRSKSSNPTSIESQIEKLKIKEAYRTYGRYINHLPVPTTPQQVPEDESERKGKPNSSLAAEVRAMSLTCLSSISKKKNFSSLLANNNPNSYNEQIQDEVIRIKTSLAKKGAPIERGSIYKALSSVPPQEVQTSVGFYTSGRDLLSNPFFPKNIGKKKKKK